MKGQGRPLGALYCWLASAEGYADHNEHGSVRCFPCPERIIGRQVLHESDGLDFFLECEASVDEVGADEPPFYDKPDR